MNDNAGMEETDTDDEFRVATGGPVTKVAAALLGGAGGLAALSWLQLTGARVFDPVARAVLWVVLAAAVIEIALAYGVMKARLGAAIAGEVVALIGAGAVGYWLYFSIANQFFSLMQVMAMLVHVTAVLAIPFAIPALKRAATARAKLRDEGLELGF